ncbi:hypothetical protein BJ878DRAFT_495381 [Calycina marina]|uniref:Uncharacterized protein n=1 Tax=Calycina marina TaxID=1763456 RepID=A0A9P8CIV1_9HELO|nr:hypothetical protein BJ878DRAFT_495381 [Calycina marina]
MFPLLKSFVSTFTIASLVLAASAVPGSEGCDLQRNVAKAEPLLTVTSTVTVTIIAATLDTLPSNTSASDAPVSAASLDTPPTNNFQTEAPASSGPSLDAPVSNSPSAANSQSNAPPSANCQPDPSSAAIMEALRRLMFSLRTCTGSIAFRYLANPGVGVCLRIISHP